VSVRAPSLLVAVAVLVAAAAPARAQSAAGADVAPAPESAQPQRAASPPSPAPDVVGVPRLRVDAPSLAAPLVAARAPQLTAPEPARIPLARRWWFWASLGTAAVGVVLAALFIGPKEPYAGNAMPGVVQTF